VEDWARSQNAEGIHGPLGFTTFDHSGILTEGFDELPTIASTYNYAYYPVHLESLHYLKDVEYVEHEIKVPPAIPEKYKRVTALTMKRNGFRLLKPGSKQELLSLGKEVFHLFNAAYEKLAYTTPLTDRQIEVMIKKYAPVLLLKYTYIALDKLDRIAGVCVAIPSLSKAFQKARGRLFPLGIFHIRKALRKIDTLDLCLVGVLPEYMNKGITALFNYEYSKTCLADHVNKVESNTVMEDNFKVNAHWNYYQSRLHKRKRIYVKEL
jgi:hypothetical protein